MITLHNFNEAHQHYQSGAIPLRLVQDQAAVMLGICTNPHPAVANALDVTDSDIHWLLNQAEATLSYSDYLGGNFYVCEVESDLKHIQGCDFEWAEMHGNWPNVTDIAMSWDDCRYLPETSGEPQWVIFFLCWSNAGGSVYYVPKHLWTIAKAEEHIAATDQTWNP